jgi:hypothetical protein
LCFGGKRCKRELIRLFQYSAIFCTWGKAFCAPKDNWENYSLKPALGTPRGGKVKEAPPDAALTAGRRTPRVNSLCVRH